MRDFHTAMSAPSSSSSHVVVLCAKLKAGKTRLSKATGPEFAHDLSRAMLQDIIETVSNLPTSTDFVLYFAPADSREEAQAFLKDMDENLVNRWTLIPMPSEGNDDLRSSQLSFKLKYAFSMMLPKYNAITFIGSDCPTLDVKGS